MTTTKVIGSPGTGKTSYLLKYVIKLLNAGVQPFRIGFYTFTRAAAKEVIDRILTTFPQYQRHDFTHFRTIHSEGARLLELQGKEMFVTDKRLQEFCKSIGYSYNSKIQTHDKTSPYDKWVTGRFIAPQVFWEIRSFGVHNCYSSDQAWSHYPSRRYIKRARFSEYNAFLKKYSAYKASEELFDYDDILMNVIQEQVSPDIDYLIVDEFQDLSPRLYQIFLQWESSMEEIIIAGDPNQAIYTFMGADPIFLRNHPADKRIVLPKSHRLPSKLLILTQNFISDPDFWTVSPAHQGGIVEKHFGKSFDLVAQLKQESGSVFLLTRTNYHLKQLMEKLISGGIPFIHYCGYSPWDRKLCILHNALLKFSSNMSLSLYEAKILLDNFPVKEFLMRGAKTKIKKALKEEVSCDFCFPDSQRVDPKRLRKAFLQKLTFSGLINSLKLGEWRKNALRKKLECSRELIDYSFLLISVGTIHSVKGREADTVFLFTDITKRIRLWSDREGEQRVWFVALTRARQKLVIVENYFNKKARNNYRIHISTDDNIYSQKIGVLAFRLIDNSPGKEINCEELLAKIEKEGFDREDIKTVLGELQNDGVILQSKEGFFIRR